MDLTNTYLSGEAKQQTRAKRGHSNDCPLVTLALVLCGNGFVQRSRVYAGNVCEASTLEQMLEGLQAPANAIVVMDRGVATASNIAWLKAQDRRYLVVNRERSRTFDADKGDNDKDGFWTRSAAVRSQAERRNTRVLSQCGSGTERRSYCEAAHGAF